MKNYVKPEVELQSFLADESIMDITLQSEGGSITADGGFTDRNNP